MSREGKRTAESPLSDDGYEKRQCGSAEDNSFLATDSDLTIVDPEFLSSTVLDNPAPEMASGIDIGRSVKDDLKAALCDPDVLELISKAVAAQVSSQLRKEIAGLRDKVAEKDREILILKDQIDSLEQYSRRNCLRISPVPEVPSESTDDIVKTVAKTIGVTLPDNAIDRSHRVGKVTAGGVNRDRPILVKFTSYKYKEAMMKAKIFPDSQWPALPARSTARVHRLYINEDLTRTRAEVAARARQLKRDGKLDDTWTRDGIIFVKKGDSVHRITTVREIHVFN